MITDECESRGGGKRFVKTTTEQREREREKKSTKLYGKLLRKRVESLYREHKILEWKIVWR